MAQGIREIEAEDPLRELAGFGTRVKDEDAVQARISEDIRVKDRTAGAALANITDGIRYTFTYPDQYYTAGVRADLRRLAAAGFREIELRNAWAWPRYKGITTCWQEPATHLIFEVQFHTYASHAAVRATQADYERLRSPAPPDAERAALAARIQDGFTAVPVPPGATGIEDHPREEPHGR